MEVECILHKDLGRYLKSDRYLSSQFLPITRHRGVSHVNNPHAKPDDLVLINIYIDGKLEAYQGFVPDTIFVENKQVHIAWLSCIWVNPKMRGKGLAKQIMKTTWKYWEGNLFSTKPSPAAKSLYLGTNKLERLTFDDTLKCHYKLNLALFLIKRNPIWSNLKNILKSIDALFNSLWQLKISHSPSNNTNFSIQQPLILDTEAFSFIVSYQKKTLIPKTHSDFEWHINFPWVKNSLYAKADQAKYFFSSYAKRFETLYLKIFEENNLAAVVILTIRNDELKIPFVYFNEENDILASTIITHLLVIMRKEKLSTIATSHKTLKKKILENKHLFFLLRKIKREYLISKKLLNKMNTSPIILQDGDGDAIFT